MSVTSVEMRLRDGTTGALVTRLHRSRARLDVHQRIGDFPGARLVLRGQDLGAMACIDVRAPELRALAGAFAALADELDPMVGDEPERAHKRQGRGA